MDKEKNVFLLKITSIFPLLVYIFDVRSEYRIGKGDLKLNCSRYE